MRIAIIAPKARNCGISQYSQILLQNLSKVSSDMKGLVKFSHLSLTIGPFINIVGIAYCMFSGRYKLLHFQYHPGLFTGFFNVFGRWLFRANFGLVYGLTILHSFLSRFRRMPKLCITIHAVFKPVHPILRKWFNKFNYVIVHSEVMRQALIEGGVLPAKIRVILHGVPNFNKECERLSKDQNKGEVKIILFGYIHENKGHHIAIEALQFLPEYYKLNICGKPRLRSHRPYFYKLRKIAEKLGLRERVEFLGFLPDCELQRVFSEGDCSIFPYLWDDNWLEWSGALGVAIAFGLPVICSDTPIFREVHDKYKCIKLFRRSNPQALACAIEQVVEDEKLRTELKDAAFIFCKNASWERVANLTLDTYLELIVDHPDYLYEDESQKYRIMWLRDQCKGKVLEVGCATGYVAAYVGAVAGIDIRLDRLILAKRKYPQIQFFLCDATRLPFSDQSYDIVLLPEILEHLSFKQAVEALREAVRVARQLVLATLPRAEHPSYTQDATLGRGNPEHLWDPTKEKIENLFKGYNYELQMSPDEKFYFVKVILEKEAL